MKLTLATWLTVARIAAIPPLLLLMAIPGSRAAWGAFAVYVLASLTDWLDGYIARKSKQVSRLGKCLDPIADKLLVAGVLMMLAQNGTFEGAQIVPACAILLRELSVSGLREFLAGSSIDVPVSRLAKWKTTAQLIALGLLILGPYAPMAQYLNLAGLVCLWFAAGLTLVTGFAYGRAGWKHIATGGSQKTEIRISPQRCPDN
ncbi:MAG: CDP-diacylglycerol--glycerol-3-phosphate 3-phosphatidyltransferase [Bdellovibrionales bacterium]